jgi:hypothetical protein
MLTIPSADSACYQNSFVARRPLDSITRTFRPTTAVSAGQSCLPVDSPNLVPKVPKLQRSGRDARCCCRRDLSAPHGLSTTPIMRRRADTNSPLCQEC